VGLDDRGGVEAVEADSTPALRPDLPASETLVSLAFGFASPPRGGG